jgi:hypothetical protein
MEETMNSNILDYMYEGYGYDFDDQRLYDDPEKYDKALTEESKMATNGMETFSHQGIVGHDPALEVEKANKYTELHQFISENGANYTDLRPRICACQ